MWDSMTTGWSTEVPCPRTCRERCPFIQDRHICPRWLRIIRHDGDAFGAGPVRPLRERLSTPQEDMDLSRASLTAIATAPTACCGSTAPARPPRSAARLPRAPLSPDASPRRPPTGSPRDPARGGRLAAYHREALVLDMASPHPSPHDGHRARFAAARRRWSRGCGQAWMPARAVPGEYCPRVQRERPRRDEAGRHRATAHPPRLPLSVVVLVGDPVPVRAVLAATYPLLGLDWDPGDRGRGGRRGPGGDGCGGRSRTWARGWRP
jgi:hypothetical protein